MLKKIVMGVATAFAVTLGAGSMTTTANAAEFSLTISDGYGGRSHAIHDRGNRGHGNRGYRRGHDGGHWGRNGNGRRGGWRHTRYNDGYGRGHRRHGREACRVVKKIVIFEDAYGNRTRKVRRHRTCGWGRR